MSELYLLIWLFAYLKGNNKYNFLNTFLDIFEIDVIIKQLQSSLLW